MRTAVAPCPYWLAIHVFGCRGVDFWGSTPKKEKGNRGCRIEENARRSAGRGPVEMRDARYRPCVKDEKRLPGQAEKGKGRVIDFAQHRARIIGSGLLEDLFEFAQRREYAELQKAAFEEYLRVLVSEVPDEPGDLIDAGLIDKFAEWFVFDHRPAAGEPTIIERYIREHSGQFTPEQAERLDQWAWSHWSVYEVQALYEGGRMLVEDVFRGTRHEVWVGTVDVMQWSLYAGRLLNAGEIFAPGPFALVVPRAAKRSIIDIVTRYYRSYRRERRGGSWAEFLKEYHLPLVHLLARAVAEAENPQITNSRGEKVVVSKAHYEVRDRAAVIKVLEGLPQLLVTGETPSRFIWTEEVCFDSAGHPKGPAIPDRFRMMAGLVEVQEDRLVVYCDSRERLSEVREALEDSAGGWLRHIADYFENIACDGFPQEECIKRQLARIYPWFKLDEAELERPCGSLQEDYYLNTWIKTRMPELGGKTPLAAARTLHGRRRLCELLKDMELAEAQKRRAGQEAFDVGILRRRLGLEEIGEPLSSHLDKLASIDEVTELLVPAMWEAGFNAEQVENAVRLWRDFLRKAGDVEVRNPGKWAAAVEFLYTRVEFEKGAPQGDVAEKYGTTAASISKAYREIGQTLDLVVYDRRYATYCPRRQLPREAMRYLLYTNRQVRR